MTSYLFGEWLVSFDNSMKQKGRNVLLLMDNVASHFPDVQLENVRLHYLPPNTTSRLQPLDAGIIRDFKSLYRHFQVKHLIDLLRKEMKADVDLKEAIRFIAMAWNSVKPETIANCWKHTGIITTDVDEDPTDSVDDLATLLDAPILSHTRPMTAEEYLSVEQELEAGETLTDDDILSLVLNEDSTDGDEDDFMEERPLPTLSEAKEASKLLQKFFEGKNDTQGCKYILDVEKILEQVPLKQSTLDSFIV